jgi:lipopolysaccharide export system permease protein
MRLNFFPSQVLTRYLARLFISRILAVLVLLVLVLQALDLLSESGKILGHPGNGEGQLWYYVSLRIPQLISRFLPYSVLLATIITLATLNQNSEVIAMKAAGLSAHQVLAPLLLSALVVSCVSFAFNERVVTRATAALKVWQDNDYGPVPKATGGRINVYFREGNDILTAALQSGSGSATVLEGVTWYVRDERGMIVEQIRGPRATFARPGWRIERPVRFDVQSAQQRSVPPLVVAPELTPADMQVAGVNADSLSIAELSRSISALEDAGRHTAELRGKWWHKLSGPLSALLMPLLGAVAAFGLARSGQLFVRAIIGMALGFAYFVVDNAALAMGNFGGYPPLLAAWAPFMLFLLVGEAVLIKTEE